MTITPDFLRDAFALLRRERLARANAWNRARGLTAAQGHALLDGLASLGLCLFVPEHGPPGLRWSPGDGDARAALVGWCVLHGVNGDDG